MSYALYGEINQKYSKKPTKGDVAKIFSIVFKYLFN